MDTKNCRHDAACGPPLDRRTTLQLAALAAGATLATGLGGQILGTQSKLSAQETNMTPKAFVYTELQISANFDDAPWREISDIIRKQPGFLNKTWLSGVATNSLGGLYAFDSIDNARLFVTGYFPTEVRQFGVAHNTRVFDAAIAEEASRDIGSVYFSASPAAKPGAFVYTEVQVSVPFDKAPWRERNPVLKQQAGLQGKTWLSGINTNSIGGFDAFDTIENAKTFAIDDFPRIAAGMNAPFYTRIFDANATEQASRYLDSPFYV